MKRGEDMLTAVIVCIVMVSVIQGLWVMYCAAAGFSVGVKI